MDIKDAYDCHKHVYQTLEEQIIKWFWQIKNSWCKVQWYPFIDTLKINKNEKQCNRKIINASFNLVIISASMTSLGTQHAV